MSSDCQDLLAIEQEEETEEAVALDVSAMPAVGLLALVD